MTLLATLAKRAEEAGLNASAPPQEAQIDGWLLRLSPGKAKRSRCVNALAQGRLPLPQLLDRCEAAFAKSGLPLIIRITPYSQPPDLDLQLQRLGWFEFDAADVMVRASLDHLPQRHLLRAIDNPAYARLVGRLRGSSETEILAHAERMQHAPRPYQGYLLEGPDGELQACGQIVVDEDMVGLFDIFTPPEKRGQGHAKALCEALLREARAQGAYRAYLQVGTDNKVAQRLYASLGFEFAYRYHYRSKDPSAAD
ncbi:GNAT family N-acetyltransferase [Pelomonas sp. SE-A7]|uniref:GNAT family N-acetyltransferase n=1 Tax=Pelomonas sp. SE-A7 TaxID=3054953 RepID=UPI00259CDB18|nr:GNAT family N-acetyltransferase [Pelomonas sp. SE-A7]MDM4768476.1 GNAT family N-acetyltransferase [Pelomonas sp. SE-A7]